MRRVFELDEEGTTGTVVVKVETRLECNSAYEAPPRSVIEMVRGVLLLKSSGEREKKKMEQA